MTPFDPEADRAVALYLEYAKLRETRTLKVLLPGLLGGGIAYGLGGSVALSFVCFVILSAVTDAQFLARETVLRAELGKLAEADPKRMQAAIAKVTAMKKDRAAWRKLGMH